MFKTIIALLLLCFSALSWAESKEVYWEDLVPKDYSPLDTPIDHNNPMAQQNLDAPIVQALNGQRVKIPGFVVPLEGEDKTITEFLLVPYFGACIHVPPPPPNQIVFVTFEKGVQIDNLYDAIWVEGTLSTQGWSGDVATVGYSLQGVRVAPFEG